MDRHLNLFYSYNQDSELIENNLTRAWIVTLRLLSPQVREHLLQHLLGKAFQRQPGQIMPQLSFVQAQFALQTHMDRLLSRRAKLRYLLTIATERLDLEAGENQAQAPLIEPNLYSDSIPDAWIFDPGGEYCFLIESKVGDYPLDPDQLFSHTEGWLGQSKTDAPAHMLSLTWVDVASAIQQLDIAMNDQEMLLLENLVEFLSLYGYRPFKGFSFAALDQPPFISIHPPRRKAHTAWMDFAALQNPPQFQLGGLP